MSDFIHHIKNKLLYLILSLFLSPLIYFFAYFSIYVFFMFFGEPLALTYIHIIFFSLFYAVIFSFIMHFSWRTLEYDYKEQKSYFYIGTFILAFVVMCFLYGTVVVSFGLII